MPKINLEVGSSSHRVISEVCSDSHLIRNIGQDGVRAGPTHFGKLPLMMADPLKEGYKKEKKWCEEGIDKSRERESDTREEKRAR